ncbi:hypothetical protein T492DRAFT_867220, partial [Pavlovales sp. CCMP2436]
MEERDEGGRLPRFYKIVDKQIRYLPFTEAKAAERVYCSIYVDALGAGLLDSRNVYEGRKDSMIAKDGCINRMHPEDWESYKSQQLKRPAPAPGQLLTTCRRAATLPPSTGYAPSDDAFSLALSPSRQDRYALLQLEAHVVTLQELLTIQAARSDELENELAMARAGSESRQPGQTVRGKPGALQAAPAEAAEMRSAVEVQALRLADAERRVASLEAALADAKADAFAANARAAARVGTEADAPREGFAAAREHFDRSRGGDPALSAVEPAASGSHTAIKPLIKPLAKPVELVSLAVERAIELAIECAVARAGDTAPVAAADTAEVFEHAPDAAGYHEPALVGASDTGAADTGAAATGAAATGATDIGAADTGAADTGAADTGAADTGFGGSAADADTGSAAAGFDDAAFAGGGFGVSGGDAADTGFGGGGFGETGVRSFGGAAAESTAFLSSAAAVDAESAPEAQALGPGSSEQGDAEAPTEQGAGRVAAGASAADAYDDAGANPGAERDAECDGASSEGDGGFGDAAAVGESAGVGDAPAFEGTAFGDAASGGGAGFDGDAGFGGAAHFGDAASAGGVGFGGSAGFENAPTFGGGGGFGGDTGFGEGAGFRYGGFGAGAAADSALGEGAVFGEAAAAGESGGAGDPGVDSGG